MEDTSQPGISSLTFSASFNFSRIIGPNCETLPAPSVRIMSPSCRPGSHRTHCIRERTHILRVPPALLADGLRQRFPADSLDRPLTRRINIEHKQRIRIAKRRGEFLDQIARARVPVRLEHNMNFAKPALSRRRQRRLDLRRMVPVIVYHAHARHPPAQLEAPVHSTELVERNADRLHLNIKPHPHRNRRRRIQNVVDSRHMQRELAQVFLAITHAKAAQRPACTAVRRRAAGIPA